MNSSALRRQTHDVERGIRGNMETHSSRLPVNPEFPVHLRRQETARESTSGIRGQPSRTKPGEIPKTSTTGMNTYPLTNQRRHRTKDKQVQGLRGIVSRFPSASGARERRRPRKFLLPLLFFLFSPFLFMTSVLVMNQLMTANSSRERCSQTSGCLRSSSTSIARCSANRGSRRPWRRHVQPPAP